MSEGGSQESSNAARYYSYIQSVKTTMTAIDELADDLGFGDYDYDDDDDDDDHRRGEDDQEARIHDQLPNVDEYKAQVGHSGGRNRSPPSLMTSICVAGCCFILVTIIIVVVVTVVMAEGELSQMHQHNATFYPWIEGDTERYLEMRRYVSTVRGISSLSFFEYGSPQFLALQWMAHGDEMKMDVPTEPFLGFDERYAIVVLYFSLDGPNWKAQLNFLTNAHICDWRDELPLGGFVSGDYGLYRCKSTSAGELYPYTFFLRKFDSLYLFRLVISDP